MLTRTILATVIVSLAVANAHRAAGDVERPTLHELAAIAASCTHSTHDKNWNSAN